MKISAFIFDLDGVIVDTAKFHFKAWRRMANAIGTDFTPEQNELLKGVSRVESMETILKWGGIEMDQEDKEEWMARKNEWYLQLVDQLTADDMLPGAGEFLKKSADMGLRLALGSASKNAPRILRSLEITDIFDSIVDGTRTTRSKPDPEVFLTAALELGTDPSESVVFEDAMRGIEAAINGGFYAVGIGDSNVLKDADFTISGLHEMSPNEVISRLSSKEI